MVRDARWKLVYIPTREGAKLVLFDTQNDPRSGKVEVFDAPKGRGPRRR